MKRLHLIFLCFLTLFSCTTESRNPNGYYERLGTAQLKEIYTRIDTIIGHRDTIPFLTYEEFNRSQYWEVPGKTKLRFPEFKVVIDGKFETQKQEDTLTVFENVGWYIHGRTFWIEPKDTNNTYFLEMAIEQNVNEMFPQTAMDDLLFDWEKWEKNSLHFLERSKFYPLEDSVGYYRLSSSEAHSIFIKQFKTKYNTTDTTHYIPGEIGGWEAAFAIDNKPMTYMPEFAVIKIIQKHKDGSSKSYFFKISYSYGC